MKRIFIAAAAALLAISCSTIRNVVDPVHKQIVRGTVLPEVVGIWNNDEEIKGEDRTGKVHDSYTFKSDGTFRQKGSMTVAMEKEAGTYTFEIAVAGGGTYGIEEGKIFFDYDPSLAAADLMGFDTKVKGKSADVNKETFNIKNFVIKPMKVSIKTTMKSDQVYTLDSVNESELVITNTKGNDRQPQSFTKLK